MRLAFVTLILWMLSTPAFAQDQKFWLDVNFGAATAAEDTHTSSTSIPAFQETATFETEYRFPRGASLDLGGGYMLTPALGIGVNFTGLGYEDFPVVSIAIPHPNFFNALGTDTGVGDTLVQRGEGAANIQVMFNVMPLASRVRVRAFAGPSFVRVEQDVVDDIHYTQNFGLFTTTNIVNATTYDLLVSKGSGWGFHAGADVSYFFNRVIGVGGFVRVIRATVELEDFSGTYDSKAGGVQSGGGVRLRF